MSIRIEILNDHVLNVLRELEKRNVLRISDDEQTRDMIGRSANVMDRPAIQNTFIRILHRHLQEIELSGELIITDPFLLNSNAVWYEFFLKRLFEPLYERVPVITFIIEGRYSPTLWDNLKNHAQGKGCTLRFFINNEYHDRFWLCATHKKGIFVGNSLTGIGAKYCFVGRLPDEDALAAYNSLEYLL
ncbi:MAG: hypothetical protein RLZZ628_2485 [Bacteroidota bacterium]|jgi:hypothetical protein